MSWWTPPYDVEVSGDALNLFHTACFESFVERESEVSGSLEGLKYLGEARAALRLEDLACREDATSRTWTSRPVSRVLTLMHSAPPHTPGGYTSRAHGLLTSLQRAGLTVRPHTRPGYLDETAKGAFSDEVEVFTLYGDMAYRHCTSRVKRVRGEYQYMLACIESYREAIRYFKPDVVHLRSTYLVALPGLIAARQLGIPTVYEVSGLWELVYEGRKQFSLCNRTTRLETITMKNVDQIATLTGAMKDVILDRGIPDHKVTITPNAVDDERFIPREQNGVHMPERLTPSSSRIVLGYAGSVVDYEGLDDLVQAVQLLQGVTKIPVHALIVGDGPERRKLEEMVDALGIGSLIEFTGRVRPDQVAQYYSQFDICVLPRKDTPATRVVSPLKPFEIMASSKPMVVSDVPALREISNDGANAKLFKAGSAQELAACIKMLCESPEESRKMADTALQFAREHHTWKTVASKMISVFQAAADRHVESRVDSERGALTNAE